MRRSGVDIADGVPDLGRHRFDAFVLLRPASAPSSARCRRTPSLKSVPTSNAEIDRALARDLPVLQLALEVEHLRNERTKDALARKKLLAAHREEPQQTRGAEEERVVVLAGGGPHPAAASPCARPAPRPPTAPESIGRPSNRSSSRASATMSRVSRDVIVALAYACSRSPRASASLALLLEARLGGPPARRSRPPSLAAARRRTRTPASSP